MKGYRQAVLGILAALLSTILLFGSVSLALIEGQISLALVVTPSVIISSTLARTNTPFLVLTSTPAALPVLTVTSLPIPPTATLSLIPFPNATSIVPLPCDYPPGWYRITVQPGDTLETLAADYGTAPEVLMAGNCLLGDDLYPGMELFVPAPPPTIEPTRCGPPSGWVYYTVQTGDTLYSLALTFGTTVRELQIANCLGSSTLIRVGQRLAVPFVPTRTPTFTLSPTLEPSPTNTEMPSPTAVTSTPVPVTLTPFPTYTSTFTPTWTPTFTPLPTDTPVGTDTPTPTPSEPSATPTPTPTEERILPSVTPSPNPSP